MICPWASRALIGRKLKGLEDAITVSVVGPVLTEQGWRFGDYPGFDRDTLNGATYLHEIYTRADPGISGRATVPVHWDRKRGTIVNNGIGETFDMDHIKRGYYSIKALNPSGIVPVEPELPVALAA